MIQINVLTAEEAFWLVLKNVESYKSGIYAGIFDSFYKEAIQLKQIILEQKDNVDLVTALSEFIQNDFNFRTVQDFIYLNFCSVRDFIYEFGKNLVRPITHKEYINFGIPYLSNYSDAYTDFYVQLPPNVKVTPPRLLHF
jgi:hypothetical protein